LNYESISVFWYVYNTTNTTWKQDKKYLKNKNKIK